MIVPFNKPYMTGEEFANIEIAHQNSHLAGDGPYTKKCHGWLEQNCKSSKALLTHSCTAALEISALLLDIQPGDEIILPSYTFVSTANAFVLRGAKPIFVDIREDTLNIDENLIADAITANTKAILPVHYAGVGCEMEVIMNIGREFNVAVVEDAAQAVMSNYDNRPLGSIGDLGAYSFHETKNVISGEGGALLIGREDLVDRAEIIREKGTDRSRFFRGQVDKYTWQEVGSSFLPGELIAAFLWAQLQHAKEITSRRLNAWCAYHEMLSRLESREWLRRPIVPTECEHNAHMYYVLLPKNIDRSKVLSHMAKDGVSAVFHYIPLHNSPAGLRYGECQGDMSVTEDLAQRLIRLPLWVGISISEQSKVCDSLEKAIKMQM